MTEEKQLVSDEKLVDVWMAHSNQMWRTVYSIPVMAVTIFVGWYSMFSQGFLFFSQAVLIVGIFIMAVQWAIIHRMAQYLIALRQAIGDALPTPPKPAVNLLGSQIAVAIPALMIAFFSVMFVVGLFGLYPLAKP